MLDEELTEEHESEISKAIGQYQFAVRALLTPLNMYGQKDYCIQVEQEFINIAWVLAHRLAELDIPFEVNPPHW